MASQNDQSSSQTTRKTRKTIIYGDSTVKNIKPWKLERSCSKEEQISVNSFRGASVHENKNLLLTIDQKVS